MSPAAVLSPSQSPYGSRDNLFFDMEPFGPALPSMESISEHAVSPGRLRVRSLGSYPTYWQPAVPRSGGGPPRRHSFEHRQRPPVSGTRRGLSHKFKDLSLKGSSKGGRGKTREAPAAAQAEVGRGGRSPLLVPAACPLLSR